jgi:uncharacterized RDD family membrane protein YckC
MNWYYVKDGQQAGPLDDAQLDQLRASGGIQDDTLIWHEGMANWQPYRDVKGAPAAPPSMVAPAAAPAASSVPGLRLSGASASTGEAPDAVCVECKNMFPKQNMIRYRDSWVCATCKPVFMQKLAEGAQLNTGEMHYAGFWIRFAAKFIDGLILGLAMFVPLIIIGVIFAAGASTSGGTSHLNFESDHSLHAFGDPLGVFGGLMRLVLQFGLFILNAIYTGFFVGKYGATPGKMACKLIVVDANGAPVSYGRAFGRGFAELVSGLICDIGYIIAAFDGQKRALHDHICSTRVIYK